MSKNHAKQTTAVFLALLMFGGTLVSCSESAANADETQISASVQNPVPGETEAAEEITVTEEIREKYKDVSYGDATIRIAGF